MADAKLWARAKEREADLAEGLPGKAEGTLGDLLERYERQVCPLKKWGRSKAHELKTLDADLGATPLAALTKQTVVDYAHELAKRMDRPDAQARFGRTSPRCHQAPDN